MEMNLQLFGGRGAGARNAAGGAGGSGPVEQEKKQPKDYTEMHGMSVDDIRDIRFMEYDDFRKFFNIPEANNYQISAIKQILDGMMKYDISHDGNKTPYKIDDISISQTTIDESEKELRKSLGMRSTASPVSVYIYTTPQTESAYLRMMDAKTRSCLIGAKGGYYTYEGKRKARKVSIKPFDIKYGHH